MNIDLQFTRYLYGKDEVEIAFMTNLLNRNEDAIFWAYELFHSGFVKELTTLLWKVYYDFYAVINPSFETYLVTKLKDIELIDDKLVYTLIKNFMIRRHNIDVFILRNIVNEFDVECTKNIDLICLLDSKDYLTISSYILENLKEEQVVEVYNKVVSYFSKLGLKIDSKKAKGQFQKQTMYINNRILLLSRVIHYFSVLHKIKMGRNLYIHIEPKECVIYETINSKLTKPYKILPMARICYIDSGNYLSLFKLKRDNTDMTTAYRENWLYHASFSPLWKERINDYNGEIRIDKKTVIFNDDEDEEKFREKYDYEPDEQNKDVQDKSIQEIKCDRTWSSFYKEHRNETIVEIDEDIIKDIEKLTY
jgi:hypothetical protein